MAKRRANGEGALFQRTTGRHAGKWVARIFAPGPTGKLKPIDRLFNTQAEAKAHLRAQINRLAEGKPVTTQSVTLGTYLATWLADRAKPRMSQNTFARYESAIVIHIRNDAITTMPLSQVNAKAILDLLARRRAQGAKAPTLQNIRATLSVALEDARREDLILDNPVSKIPPQVRHKSDARFLTPEQSKALLDAAEGHEVRPLLVVALRVGMRLSEILGLTWDCIDFANKKITIKQQLQRHDGKFYIGETKTSGTRRTVKVHPEVLKQFELAKETQSDEPDAESEVPNLVFRSRSGAPYHRKTILDWTNRFMKEAGIPEHGFHALRHTCASILINAGADPLRVQKHLGHSNVRVTMGTYAHLFDERLDENNEILDRALS